MSNRASRSPKRSVVSLQATSTSCWRIIRTSSCTPRRQWSMKRLPMSRLQTQRGPDSPIQAKPSSLMRWLPMSKPCRPQSSTSRDLRLSTSSSDHRKLCESRSWKWFIRHDLRVASEDLSDRLVVDQLSERKALGHHDRILVGDRSSAAQKRSVTWLRHDGVQVQSIASGYMHEKNVDTATAVRRLGQPHPQRIG